MTHNHCDGMKMSKVHFFAFLGYTNVLFVFHVFFCLIAISDYINSLFFRKTCFTKVNPAFPQQPSSETNIAVWKGSWSKKHVQSSTSPWISWNALCKARPHLLKVLQYKVLYTCAIQVHSLLLLHGNHGTHCM